MRKSRDDVSRKRSGNGTRKDNKLVELPSREREPSRTISRLYTNDRGCLDTKRKKKSRKQ